MISNVSTSHVKPTFHTTPKPPNASATGVKKVHISTFDSVTISDEARQRAAEGGPLTHEESLLLSIEARRANGHGLPEYIPMWNDSWGNSNNQPAPHLHNLGGRLEITVGNGQPFTAILRDEGIWIASGHNPERSDFMQIFPQQTIPGIPPSTIRGLDFTLRIIQNINVSEGNHLFDDFSSFDMRDGLSRVLDGFAALREELGIFPGSTQHFEDPIFQDALRVVLRNFFDEAARMDSMYTAKATTHPDSAEAFLPDSTELQEKIAQQEQMRSDARNQADVFTSVFFANFLTHGMEGAFNIAWDALQSN